MEYGYLGEGHWEKGPRPKALDIRAGGCFGDSNKASVALGELRERSKWGWGGGGVGDGGGGGAEHAGFCGPS